ncbi:DUF3347 domain-containing protein [Nonlabens marinus]|uniref:Probable Co/Zn/Cd efflux system membrane fusion protein n=1 Tax=Nonlabens marinus S1-08 TaxID=1454201 RepID=W8VZ96_9FLAO|nr:DUF3347 domain-containing protein [Nonlabens marinus]BAO54191.1 probable Co/Zn/Cd efflux system membrane fusion protein [Nonlabens marinus S1-08]
MKTSIKITTALFATLSIFSCKNVETDATATDADEITVEETATDMASLEFNNEATKEMFQHYVHIKTALVNSDLDEAKSGAQMLIKASTNEEVTNALTAIATANDIETQRTAFSTLTTTLTPIIENDITSGEIYQQFCPMAFNNAGGYWLSKEEEIRNPYYGDRMLKCGRVAQTIK